MWTGMGGAIYQKIIVTMNVIDWFCDWCRRTKREKENDLCHQKLSERFQISMGAISNVPHIQKWIFDYLKSVCVTDTELVKMINYLCLYCKGSETNSVFLLSSWWQMHEDVSIALVVRAPEAQDNTPQQTRHLTKETEQIYPQ